MEENVKKDCRQLMIYEKFVHKVDTPEYIRKQSGQPVMIKVFYLPHFQMINGWIVTSVMAKLKLVRLKIRKILITII